MRSLVACSENEVRDFVCVCLERNLLEFDPETDRYRYTHIPARIMLTHMIATDREAGVPREVAEADPAWIQDVTEGLAFRTGDRVYFSLERRLDMAVWQAVRV